MAQISYGTITITDTTDKTVYIAYASDSNGSNFSTTPSTNLLYVGINISTSTTMPPSTDNNWVWSKYAGTDGVSVISVTEIYQLRDDSVTPTKRTDGTALPTAVDTINTWSLKVPPYVNGGTYWVSTAVTMNAGTSPVYTTPVKNQGLTDANYNAAMSNSIAQQTIENAQGALSIASATEIAQEALATKLKYIWTDETEDVTTPAGSYMASGIRDVTLDTSNPSTYGFNSQARHTHTAFRYNAIDLTTVGIDGVKLYIPVISNGVITDGVLGAELTTNGLNFYQPPTISGSTVTSGGLAMQLTGDALKFYNSNDGTNIAQFGDSVRIGTENDASITITDSNIIGVGKSNSEYFKFVASSVSTPIFIDETSSYWRVPASEWPRTSATSNTYTLKQTPVSGETMFINCYVGDFRTNQYIATPVFQVTTGTAESNSQTFTVDNKTFTCYVTYDGNETINNLYISGTLDDNWFISLHIQYHINGFAPTYHLGSEVKVTGPFALAEGHVSHSYGYASHAEGANTYARGDYSHAEGYWTDVTGNYSHAEGRECEAIGWHSHAEGFQCIASGYNSHAGGIECVAEGNGSFVHGWQLRSGDTTAQAVFGKYNIRLSSVTTPRNVLFIIGNGTADDARSNALTVDSLGNVDIASGGKYKINGIDLSAVDVGAVPTSRTVNSKALSSDITLSASDVGAVPTTRTVNGKALSSNISLTASDVGAAASSAIPTTTSISSNVTTSTGTYVSSSCYRYGNIVYLSFRFRNTSSVASGSNVYNGTLSTTVPRPRDGGATSSTYYGGHALIGTLNTNGVLTIRNTSTSAVQYGSSDTGTISFTYICS